MSIEGYDLRCTNRVFEDIQVERFRLHVEEGQQSREDGTGGSYWVREESCAHDSNNVILAAGSSPTWTQSLHEHFAGALAVASPGLLRYGLIRTAAVITAWIEDLDRRAEAIASVEGAEGGPQ